MAFYRRSTGATCNPRIYKGQKQIWFLLKLISPESAIKLDTSLHPEFDSWRWNNYFASLGSVIEFKRDVYHQALTELSHYLFSEEELARIEKEGH